MDSFLAVLGMLFFMFLVLAAAVEVILEMLRGVLERLGVTWAKSKISLEEALALSQEFAPENSDLTAKIEALKNVADQLGSKSVRTRNLLQDLQAESPQIIGERNAETVAKIISQTAASIKQELDADQRKKIFIIRSLAALIGCLLVWQSQFYVFQILASSPGNAAWAEKLTNLNTPWVNVITGGLAAAAGSSYWHDQIDRVRSLKRVADQVKALQAE